MIPVCFPVPVPAHFAGEGLSSSLHKLLVFSFFYVLYQQVYPAYLEKIEHHCGGSVNTDQ